MVVVIDETGRKEGKVSHVSVAEPTAARMVLVTLMKTSIVIISD